MSSGYFEKRQADMGMLRSVAEGSRVAHIWGSHKYLGAIIAIQYRWPEVEIEEDEHGLPAAFADDVELHYAGTMTKEVAAAKLADIRAAAGQMDIPPSNEILAA